MPFVISQLRTLNSRNQVTLIPIFLYDKGKSIKSLIFKLFEIDRLIKQSSSRMIVMGCTGSIPGFLAVFFAWLNKLPSAVYLRGSDINHVPSDGVIISRIRNLLSTIGCFFTTKVISVSPKLLERIPRTLRKKASVISSGVDVSVFRPLLLSQLEQTYLLKHFSLPCDKKILLLNVSKSPVLKGLPVARKVYNVLEKDYPGEYHLCIISAGQYTSEEVAQLMNLSYCLLMLSQQEGSPNVVKEALACGLPIISLDVGDVCLHSHHLPNALKIVQPDSVCIAQSIVDLSYSPSIAHASFQYIDKYYSLTTQNSKLFTLLSDLAL